MITSRIDNLDRLQSLTREYAAFSRSASGLGNALGGLIAVGIWWVGSYTDLPLGWRAALALALPAWIRGKAWLRQNYYQRQGVAVEALAQPAEALERFSQGCLAGVAGVLLAICLYLVVANPAKMTGVPLQNKLALVGTPLFALLRHRRINTPFEAVVAVNLVVQTIMLIPGTPVNWHGQNTTLAWSILLVAIGVWEHFRFREVESQLYALRASQ